jgi:hypothetical protein
MKRISADSLIELALATLRTELMPNLPAEKRYEAAMVANALEIARREYKVESDTPLWPLLDELYDDGDGSPKQLAFDIRKGTFSEAENHGLGDKLLAMVRNELEVRNPRFLAGRKGA